MLVEQTNASHYLIERGASATITTIFVMKLLWAVNAYPYEPPFATEELTPLVGE